jgi:hypothetical protein
MSSFSARNKIVKERGADPDAFEMTVAQVGWSVEDVSGREKKRGGGASMQGKKKRAGGSRAGRNHPLRPRDGGPPRADAAVVPGLSIPSREVGRRHLPGRPLVCPPPPAAAAA